jgi:Thymidylate synthase
MIPNGCAIRSSPMGQRRAVPELTATRNQGLTAGYDPVLAMQPAFDESSVLHSPTIGESWFAVARRIVACGLPSLYDGLPIRELSLITLVIARPEPEDELIATHADPERLAWMHANFTDHVRVASLGDADSYATRLFDYEHSGLNQVAWVIERLRADPSSRSATITTFQPRTDTTYIPCVSMLDFWLPEGAVELVVYAHSIDFGAKGYGNLVELASLQHHVADALGRPVGRLVMIIKSAHVYETELSYIERVLARDAVGRSRQQSAAGADSQHR